MMRSLTVRRQAWTQYGAGRTFVFLFALLGVMTAASISASAAVDRVERILQFDSEIWIHRDGALSVRETIEVNAARRDIRHGIYRDFPTLYNDRYGTRYTVGFAIEEITRDGKPEPYHTERRANGIRVYIGSKNVDLPPGRYVYTITYRTDRQLFFGKDSDEIYWNVTGNAWTFPIEHARAIVHLPEGARVRDHSGYTGPQGATGQDFRYSPLVDGVVRFETTRPLRPAEGLTVAVSWPTGFVQRPSRGQQIRYFMRDNSVLTAGGLGLGLLLLYYLYFWSKVGRDPRPGVIVPLYEPPGALSPAGARFVSRFGFDDKTFTAAVVNMAVKGHLTIREDDEKTFTLTAAGKDASLSPGEQAIARKLFPGGRGTVELKQKNHKILGAAKDALEARLRGEYEKTHFLYNTRYFVPGAILSLLLLGVNALAADQPEVAGFLTVWLAGWSVGVYFLAHMTWRAWRGALTGGVGNAIGALFSSAFALPFFGGEIMGLFFYASVASYVGAFLLLVILGVNLVFYQLLKAPTRLGRRLMDQIEGFKLYLSVAEKDRMNMLNPPERTPELFEKYLPYALALDVEQQWAEQFAGVLAAASAAPGSGSGGRVYSPGWYSGNALDRGLGGFGSSLGGAFAGAIASASTAPGSSGGSGGSGGGSSGGGGGGGGGGGW